MEVLSAPISSESVPQTMLLPIPPPVCSSDLASQHSVANHDDDSDDQSSRPSPSAFTHNMCCAVRTANKRMRPV